MVLVSLSHWPHQAAMQGLPGYGSKDTYRRKNERNDKKLIKWLWKYLVNR